MVTEIQYTGELIPVELTKRPLDGIADLWMRKNPRTEVDPEGNIIQLADEAYMTFKIGEEPTQEEVEADFDSWFASAAAPEATLQDALDAINILSSIIFGGE